MRIAIVGCGIGGMAAAIALSRSGHEITLYERFARPHPVGAGLLLQPSGLEALGVLGLREEIEAAGARILHLQGRTVRGREVLNLSYAHWRAGAYGVGVHRARLFSALFAALRRTSAEIVTETEIVGLQSHATPVLICAEGARHGPFDLAILADGAGSALREKVAPHARAPLYPWGAIWAIRPDPDDRWAGALAQVYDGCEVMLGVMPVGAAPSASGPHVTLFWSLREDEHVRWRAGGLALWRQSVARYWPQAASLLGDDLDFAALNFARYRDVQSWPWGAGATVLVGDSAHATSPQLGQGANLALADAVALAATLKRDAPAKALRAYRHARAGKVAWVQFMSAALTPLFQSRSRVAAWLRDWIMPPLAKIWPFDRLMLATLTGAGVFPFALQLSSLTRFLLWRRRRT